MGQGFVDRQEDGFLQDFGNGVGLSIGFTGRREGSRNDAFGNAAHEGTNPSFAFDFFRGGCIIVVVAVVVVAFLVLVGMIISFVIASEGAFIKSCRGTPAKEVGGSCGGYENGRSKGFCGGTRMEHAADETQGCQSAGCYRK